jgi:hypothetical protein
MVVGLVAFAVIDLPLGAGVPGGAGIVAAAGGAILAMSVLIVTLAGAVIGWRAERRSLAGKRVSHLGIAMTLMAIGALSTVVLLIAVTIIGASGTGA